MLGGVVCIVGVGGFFIFSRVVVKKGYRKSEGNERVWEKNILGKGKREG